MSSQAVSENLLTREEVAKRLRISVQLLDDLRVNKKIAYIQLGRRILFKESELLHLIEQNTVK